MPEKKRFIKRESFAGAWFIKDTKDDTIVCHVSRSGRPQAHTEAMLNVMLDALNNAVERKNGIQ